MNKVNITIPLPEELNDRLVKFCKDEERSKTFVVKKALNKYLPKEEK